MPFQTLGENSLQVVSHFIYFRTVSKLLPSNSTSRKLSHSLSSSCMSKYSVFEKHTRWTSGASLHCAIPTFLMNGYLSQRFYVLSLCRLYLMKYWFMGHLWKTSIYVNHWIPYGIRPIFKNDLENSFTISLAIYLISSYQHI